MMKDSKAVADAAAEAEAEAAAILQDMKMDVLLLTAEAVAAQNGLTNTVAEK